MEGRLTCPLDSPEGLAEHEPAAGHRRPGPGSEQIITSQTDQAPSAETAAPAVRTRRLNRLQLGWRIGVAVAGIVLLLNGSARMSDDVWPFGPLSQYAFSPSFHDTVVITRVEGQLADGRRVDLPLRVGESGIGRAEVEAQIPDIQARPALLDAVADGWTRQHPGEPKLLRVWLVQDRTELSHGHQISAQKVELANWSLPG